MREPGLATAPGTANPQQLVIGYRKLLQATLCLVIVVQGADRQMVFARNCREALQRWRCVLVIIHKGSWEAVCGRGCLRCFPTARCLMPASCIWRRRPIWQPSSGAAAAPCDPVQGVTVRLVHLL